MALLYAFRPVEIRFWLLAETRKNILFHHQIPDINTDVHIQKTGLLSTDSSINKGYMSWFSNS